MTTYPPALELNKNLVNGTLTGTGAGNVFQVGRTDFVAGLGGVFVATVQLERNRGNGLGWVVVAADPTNQVGTGGAIYTAPVELDVFEPLIGTQYRWNCTAFTSGSIGYEIQGG